MQIKLIFDTYSVQAEIKDTPTGRDILDNLPLESSFTTWGNEIYFSIPVKLPLESDARSTLEIGELGFYPPMSAFCIFFGPTPMSMDGKPQAAGDVNVFGKLIEVDVAKLSSIRGTKVRVEKV